MLSYVRKLDIYLNYYCRLLNSHIGKKGGVLTCFQDPFVNVISYHTRNIKSMLMLPVTKYLDANAACHNGLLLSNRAF